MLFAYRLAKAFGEPNVAKFVDSMTVDQFCAWMAYDDLEGGIGREWVGVGLQTAYTVAASTGKFDRRVFEDFMPPEARKAHANTRPRPADPQELAEKLEAFKAIFKKTHA